MSQTTTERKAANGNGVAGADPLQQVADDLLTRAVAARTAGDSETAAKLFRAAADVMGDPVDTGITGDRSHSDGRRQTTPETEKIKAMMRERWCEASELQEATGLNANRVHSLLGRLKNSRELRFEKRTLTQYRLAP